MSVVATDLAKTTIVPGLLTVTGEEQLLPTAGSYDCWVLSLSTEVGSTQYWVAKADRMRHNGSMGRRLFSRVCRENQRMRPPLRSLLLLGLLPLALAACGGGGGGATSSATTAQTTTSAAHQTKQVTIRVTSVVTSTKAHQRVPKRTSAGDRVEFKDRLLNASAGQFGKSSNEQVGTDTVKACFAPAPL